MLEAQEILLRLFLAALVGGLIGLERQRRNHPAGFRTHTLVSLGSALIMITSEEVALRHAGVNADPGRIAAQVVSGIGFLGAGTIMREGLTVRGLTTAASLWVVAALGLSIGGGHYVAAAGAALLTLITLGLLNHIEHTYLDKGQYGRIHLVIEDRPGGFGAVAAEMDRLRVNVRNMHVEQAQAGEMLLADVTVILPAGVSIQEIVQALVEIPHVRRVEYEVV